MYDITDVQSFEKVKNWVKELRKIVGNDIVIAIAGNKLDLEKNRKVNEQEAVRWLQTMFTVWFISFRYAESVGATHFHTSAKTNRGLDESFIDIAQRIPQPSSNI